MKFLTNSSKIASLILIFTLFVWVKPVGASHSQTSKLIFLDQKKELSIPSQNDIGGFSVAIADLGTDGTEELIVGNGMGAEPRVHILRQNGSEIGSFLAYAPTLGTGINVVVCDLNGDGLKEIITSAQRGGGPHIRVFDRLGEPIGNGIFAYDKSFRGGVNLACGNIIGDETDELITLPAAGGGPHVRVWNLENNTLNFTTEFFAFDSNDRSGLVGTVKNKNLIVAQQDTSKPTIKTFVLQNKISMIEERKISIDATGIASIVIHNQERILSTTSNSLIYNIDTNTHEKISNENKSFVLASGSPLIASQGRPSFDDSTATRILVDISEQRLYAYTDGILENSFLISSGKNNLTPLGNHHILAKIPFVDYRWNYGLNDPRNYDLGLVPYNLRFYPHIYLHYAYWHNNFGHPMSHGCINVSLNDMKWLYDWAKVDMQMDVVE